MKNKFKTLLFLISFLFNSCESGVNIEKLQHRELAYRELPNAVQKLLIDISDGNSSLSNMNIMVLDKTNNYNLVVVKTGPWVDYSLLERDDRNMKFRIPRGFAHPFILYNNKMYLSKDYNIISLNNYNNMTISLYHEFVLE